MKIKTAISALKEKQAIISRTDDDHWLYEPIAMVLEELEIYKKALEMACGEIERRAPYPKVATIIAEDWERFYIKKARENNDA